MTKLLSIAFILISSITSYGQFLEFEDLMGKEDIFKFKIKSVRIYDNSISDTTLTQKKIFDKNGNLTQDLWYKAGHKDSITNNSTYEYDSQQNRIQSSHCILLGTGVDTAYPYDIIMRLVCSNYESVFENGRLKRMDSDSGAYFTNGVHFKEYEYDANGNLIKVLSHDTIDNETDSIVYTYNQFNRMLQYNSYDVDGRLKYFQVYHYDNNGQLIEVNCKNTGEGREVQEDYHYKYNGNGKRTQWDRYGFWTKNPTSIYYEYDLKGRLVKYSVDEYVNVFEYEYY